MRSISNCPVAILAINNVLRLVLYMASAKPTEVGSTPRACSVDSGKSGIASTTESTGGHSKRTVCTWAFSCAETTMPPYNEAATLSGCPSNSVAKLRSSTSENGRGCRVRSLLVTPQEWLSHSPLIHESQVFHSLSAI